MTEEEVKGLIQELRDEIPAIIEKFNEDLEAERVKLREKRDDRPNKNR
jgi:hypothetical protein|tara:strand:+ start:1016 stop:1159 length:144 start_codon:yes stop_codon:yes gene_type:complete